MNARTINLFVLDAIYNSLKNKDSVAVYTLNNNVKSSEIEMRSLHIFVDFLISKCNLKINDLNGFNYSYNIPQISKEFDLLRLTKNSVLNIELKSNSQNLEKARKQLIRNKGYLKFLNLKAWLFTFFDNGDIYTLNDNDEYLKTNKEQLISAFNVTNDHTSDDFDLIFNPVNFLIDPITDIEKFKNGCYFLTDQQEEIVSNILNDIDLDNTKIYGISGAAGTGKSLVLYHLARLLSKKYKCCIVHCAPISDKHVEFVNSLNNICLVSPKEFSDVKFPMSDYDFFFFDEFQRAYNNVIPKVNERTDKKYMFFFDEKQVLSRREISSNVLSDLRTIPNFKPYNLTKNIRSNSSVIGLINFIFDLRNKLKTNDLDNFCILYSNERKITKSFLSIYKDLGYQYIYHSVSFRHIDQFDDLLQYGISTHDSIGHEYTNIIVVLNEFFYYENGLLKTKPHPFPALDYSRLLYEELTRAKSKICLIIEKNESLFKEIINALQIT